MTKTDPKTRYLITYLLAIFCGILFFSFEFVPNFSDEYSIALKEYRKLKKENTLALNKLKEASKNTPEYAAYKAINKKKVKAFKKYQNIKEEEAVFGFNNLKVFLYQLGITVCLFVYGVFNLYRSFYFERKNFSNKLLHSFIIFISLFKFYWVFQSFKDYNVFTYSVVSIFSLFILILFVRLKTKYEDHNINKLKKYLYEISKKALLSAKSEEKREEILDMVTKINKGKAIN
ncbi:conserved membrane hypothetical protein [Tenacibaculum sp. 190524A02b]|uniref:Uncharacterized protein n=1 Tax=Tenacibaculum vairaonense TaxID=3137860 RepID=A0ABM9PS41_9FLAO